MVEMSLILDELWEKIISKQISYDEVLNVIEMMKRKEDISFKELNCFIDRLRKDGFDQLTGRLLTLGGWFCLEEHLYEEAIDYFELGLELLERTNSNIGIIANYSGRMCAYFYLGMYDESLDLGKKGLRLAKECNDDEQVIQMLGNIALSYFELGLYEESRKSLDAVRKLNQPKSEANQVALDQLEARICLIFEELERAEFLLERAYQQVVKIQYPILTAETLRIRGMLHYKLKDYEKCRQNFKSSIELAVEKNYVEQFVLTYYEWGKVESSLDNDKIAKEYLLKAYEDSQNLKSPLIYTNICKSLVQLYKKMGDFEKALEYYEINAEYAREMDLKKSKIWSQHLLREKELSEAKIFKSLYGELQMISEIGLSFTRGLHFDKIIRNIKEKLSKMMDTTVLIVAQYDIDEKYCKYTASIGAKEELVSGTIDFNVPYSLGAYCLEHKKDFIIFDTDEECDKYRLKKVDESEEDIKSLVCCPLIIQDEVTGYISIQSYEKGRYHSSDLTKLSLLASYIAIALENAKLYSQMNYLARYDGLTGVYNRVEVLNQVTEMFNLSDNKRLLSLVMFDLDYFKKINDTYGHQAGDKVLNEVGNLLREKQDESIIFGRYGGEEFIIFLRDHDAEAAFNFAQSIRKQLEQLSFDFFTPSFNKITASFGVYEYNLEKDLLDDGIFAADHALYQSKEKGRNCITIY